VSVLVVGLSHKSAPLPVLERAAVSGDTLRKLLDDVFRAEDVAGAFVISTCNRVEVYADVDRFHGSVSAICELLSRYSGISAPELTAHLYVHYEERAVKHLLAVACGLDSMVVGEGQILGQVRKALNLARDAGTLGRSLGSLGAAALRTGKRAHAETGIDRMGASLVSVGIEVAAGKLRAGGQPHEGQPHTGPHPGGQCHGGQPGATAARTAADAAAPGEAALREAAVLVVGAGAMSALAATTAARYGASRITVVNRTRRRAERLAASVGGHAADLADLPRAMAAADLVISCTGASGLVITADAVAASLALRATRGGTGDAPRPLVLLDLAMPRDVDPCAAELPGVSLVGMEELAGSGRGSPTGPGQGPRAAEVAAVRAIVKEEFAAYRSAEHAAKVTPTVVALRAKAAEVVDAELARLAGRLQGIEGLDGHALDEVARTVRRVVDKLLHAPTVRVKELAGSPGGPAYDTALRVLFDLDPGTVEAVARADDAGNEGELR